MHFGENYLGDNRKEMTDQPLHSDFDIHEADVSVDLQAPLAGYTCHTLNPPYILYMMPCDVY
jgi:hypothetical protein